MSTAAKTITEIYSMFSVLRSLNGSERVFAAPDGTEKIVSTPYQFTGGACAAIAKNMNALRQALTESNEARELLVKGFAAPEDKKETDEEKLAREKDLEAQLKELDEKKYDLAISPIKIGTLRLDANAIPPGNISDLIHHGLIVE